MPGKEGRTTDGSAELADLLAGAVADRLTPGAVAVAGVGPTQLMFAAVGQTSAEPGQGVPVTGETRFDMASLTKVMATLPAVLLLAAQGRIALEDPVARHVEEFASAPKSRVRVEHLLTHTSGLAAHREYFRTLRGHDAIVRAVLEEPLEADPGTRVVYSDLGFIVLGEIVRRVAGERLDAFARRHIFDPLGMRHTTFLPDGAQGPPIAATERLPGAPRAKVGVVHDDNAEAMGGVAGHAGLFSTARDVVRYVRMWLDRGPSVLSLADREASVRLRTAGLDGRRGLGWVLGGDAQFAAGPPWPPTAAGHTGYTGTSVVFDPGSGAWAVLLTNRVHFGRTVDVGPLRRRFHDLVARRVGRL